MSLQVILDKIRASGEVQIQEIEQASQIQVNALLAQAGMEAHELGQESTETASYPANAERARILHHAHLESLRIVGDVRAELVEAAISRAREGLAGFRSESFYPAVLRRLVQEALAELDTGGADNAILLADPRDRNWLVDILNDLGLDLPVSYEISCWGGLVAKSQDGRVVVTNTLESRLERATGFLRSRLAALFEEEESGEKDLIHA